MDKYSSRFLNSYVHSIKRFKITNYAMFMIVGLPSFLVALLINYTIVYYLNWFKPIVYAIVIVIQVSINFFMCRLYVFKNEATTSLSTQGIQFISGSLAFRFFDWLLYSILTQILSIHFTIIQIVNVVIFSLLKYKFAKRVIEGK